MNVGGRDVVTIGASGAATAVTRDVTALAAVAPEMAVLAKEMSAHMGERHRRAFRDPRPLDKRPASRKVKGETKTQRRMRRMAAR